MSSGEGDFEIDIAQICGGLEGHTIGHGVDGDGILESAQKIRREAKEKSELTALRGHPVGKYGLGFRQKPTMAPSGIPRSEVFVSKYY